MSTAEGRTPPWPSLYNPGVEILNLAHRAPVQPEGSYLYHPKDIFRFTLYWTLIFYTPIFLFCGSYAFWNYTFPPTRPSIHVLDKPLPLLPLSPPALHLTPSRHTTSLLGSKLHKPKERRSRLAFALIVLLTFTALSVAGGVIGSAVLGFALAGLYKAAQFNMSTWIPFLLAVIQVVVGLLSIWPSIIDII